MDDAEIKLRFDYVSRDIGKLELAVTALTATVNTLAATLNTTKAATRNWPGFISMLLIVIPMYALIIDIIVKGLK